MSTTTKYNSSHNSINEDDDFKHRGFYFDRQRPIHRDYSKRAFTIGIAGPVGSGKTTLIQDLCEVLRDSKRLAVVTNDIFTQEDAEYLQKNQALDPERIISVQTANHPHVAIHDNINKNLNALNQITKNLDHEIDWIFLESGGDNLATSFSRELADFTIYVIDVSGGDKIPRKGGPGITQSDLLIINKIDLAEMINADLELMERDSEKMRGEGPFIFTQCRAKIGINRIVEYIEEAYKKLV